MMACSRFLLLISGQSLAQPRCTCYQYFVMGLTVDSPWFASGVVNMGPSLFHLRGPGSDRSWQWCGCILMTGSSTYSWTKPAFWNQIFHSPISLSGHYNPFWIGSFQKIDWRNNICLFFKSNYGSVGLCGNSTRPGKGTRILPQQLSSRSPAFFLSKLVGGFYDDVHDVGIY